MDMNKVKVFLEDAIMETLVTAEMTNGGEIVEVGVEISEDGTKCGVDCNSITLGADGNHHLVHEALDFVMGKEGFACFTQDLDDVIHNNDNAIFFGVELSKK